MQQQMKHLSQRAMLALCLVLPAPMIGIFASLYMPPFGQIQVGQVIWFLMKVWLVALPVLWLLYIDRGKLSWSPTTKKGVCSGLVWALLMTGVIIGGYFFFLNSIVDKDGIRGQIEQFGLTLPLTYWLFAIAVSFGNALMEEYVWRWFVFTKCRTLFGVCGGIIFSALFFTLHHVIVIWNFGDGVLVVFSSLGIFFGGVVWAWLYNKYNSIWPGYISHVAADLAIFWIGWTLVVSS